LGYRIDVAIPHLRIGVEINGPDHCACVPCEYDENPTATYWEARQMRVATNPSYRHILREKVLKGAGWTIIPFWWSDFDQLSTFALKQAVATNKVMRFTNQFNLL
jgi:very-short-patch-repair endonuclease